MELKIDDSKAAVTSSCNVHNYIYLITRVAICREAHKNRGTDRELVGLAKYLTLIAKLDDFSNLRWIYEEMIS